MKQRVPLSSVIRLWGLGRTNTNKQVALIDWMVDMIVDIMSVKMISNMPGCIIFERESRIKARQAFGHIAIIRSKNWDIFRNNTQKKEQTRTCQGDHSVLQMV